MTQRRALISVYKKEGVVDFAQKLSDLGWEIISTGGTARKLKDSGLQVTDITDITNHPECFDGRVKTLHPAVHSGLLARRDNSEDMQTLTDLGYGSIDLVCVNLYPFSETAERKPPVDDNELIEMIDIGGPTMIRSAAKNHKDVLVVTSPDQYQMVVDHLAHADGNPDAISMNIRRKLALQAFQVTSRYDSEISTELDSRYTEGVIPTQCHISTQDGVKLRYGENPHQVAAFFPGKPSPNSLAAAIQHGGKPLSYNNYLDLDSALKLVTSLSTPDFEKLHACVVIKHTNPSGASIHEEQEQAWEHALTSDPESAFGCVVAFSKKVGMATAEAIGDHFFECMIAPGYDDDALLYLSTKKNRRMMTLATMSPRLSSVTLRQIEGGWLSQSQGPPQIDWDSSECVTKTDFSNSDMMLAKFGTTVISEVKSNAILLVKSTTKGFTTVGVGPGQTSRVEAVRIAARRAGKRAKGSMMISDAFFPFRDGIDAANEIGVTHVVQPGGSMRDSDSILAANEHGISMIFTKKRLFLH